MSIARGMILDFFCPIRAAIFEQRHQPGSASDPFSSHPRYKTSALPGGLRIAVKRGSALYHVHGDHLGSASLTTAGSVEEGSRTYHPYGSERSASGTLRTDRTYTGQKEDGTGLLYYNARYYDPALGTFISPDSLVPDAGMVVDYNRFLYARGNPLKYSDPSGYAPQYYGDPDPNNAPCATDWCWENRWYEAHGYGYNSRTRHWDRSIPNRFADLQIWRDYIGELTEGLQEEPSRLSWQDWSYVARIGVMLPGLMSLGQFTIVFPKVHLPWVLWVM